MERLPHRLVVLSNPRLALSASPCKTLPAVGASSGTSDVGSLIAAAPASSSTSRWASSLCGATGGALKKPDAPLPPPACRDLRSARQRYHPAALRGIGGVTVPRLCCRAINHRWNYRASPLASDARAASSMGGRGQSPARGRRALSPLFDSIDEGFCVVEVLLDAQGTPTDYRFLRWAAFERHTGLRDVTGKCMRDIEPTTSTGSRSMAGSP